MAEGEGGGSRGGGGFGRVPKGCLDLGSVMNSVLLQSQLQLDVIPCLKRRSYVHACQTAAEQTGMRLLSVCMTGIGRLRHGGELMSRLAGTC